MTPRESKEIEEAVFSGPMPMPEYDFDGVYCTSRDPVGRLLELFGWAMQQVPRNHVLTASRLRSCYSVVLQALKECRTKETP